MNLQAKVFIGCALAVLAGHAQAADQVRKLVFDGVLCEHKIALSDLDPAMPSDWSGYSYLVMDMRTSSPQRAALWIHTADGLREMTIQPFGQNVWLRASIPLQFFLGMDRSGTDLASAHNRRTKTFWMMVSGPFGPLKSVQAIGLEMDYPINRPTIEIRAIHLSKQDEGSQFLQDKPLRDEFGQWALVDWPRKITSREQLRDELADEARHFGTAADFGYDRYGGYQNTHADATGFFRVQRTVGKWWFVDPDGHWFLSTGINGTGAGFGGRPAPGADADALLTARRLESWGMTTGGQGRPSTVFLNWPRDRQTTFLGLPDVYSDAFARGVDEAARRQCTPRRDDPLVLGYFVGNEPPWCWHEEEVVEMILAGPDTATQAALKDYLAQSDTPARRRDFVRAAFKKYLELICGAVRKYDPNHLILGIRFGGSVPDEVLIAANIFDVCSINVYEYEPTKQVQRAYRLSDRPILIGEFHIGVPENGLGAGLVQAKDQTQRAIGYRYYVEQAAALEGFVGAYWFQWRDEPVLGRMDGENYNIGFVDVTNRPYPELVQAAKATNKRLEDIHAGRLLPLNQKPLASDAGSPSSPWDN